MKKALEGLSGVVKVEMDVERDLFRITLADQGAPTQEALFKTITELNYTPSLASPESFRTSAKALQPKGEPPQVVQKALARARAQRKLVLVDCMGDN